jgi:flagellar hook-associated protein 3 FlgL
MNQFADNNIPDAISWMNVTENALTNMKDILTDIRTQCVNGSTDTLTAADRQTILDSLKSLTKQVYAEGNAEYAGKSVFTGYRTADTLTFQHDEPDTKYEIVQNFDYKSLEETRYYTGDVEVPEALTDNTLPCTTTVSENSYDRVRLAYNGDITVDEFKVSYKDADGNTQEVTTNLTTYETEREWEAAKQAAGEEGKVVGDDEVIFIEETGEFIFGKNVADSITDNKADIHVEYTKKGFENGEAKPYYYYDCKDVTKDDPKLQVSYKKENQEINYTTAINTVTTINTQADSVLSTDIHRDVNELVNVVQRSLDAEKKVEKLKVMMDEPQYQDEESQKMLQGYLDAATKEMDYADDNMQKVYERYITRFDGYMENVNIAIIDVGSKQNSLSLTKVRVENQQTTIEELKSNNEDRDISDIIIDYYASYNAYTSSLTAAGKLNESNLLQYI